MHSAIEIAVLIQLCWQTRPFSATTVVESTLSIESSLKMVNESQGWALGDYLMRTSDGGKSWQAVPRGADQVWVSPSWGTLRDGGAWYLGSKTTTGGEVPVLDFVRQNNGRPGFVIRPQPLPCSVAVQCAAVDFDADGMIGVLVVRDLDSFESGRLQFYLTRDGGTHWTPSRSTPTRVGSREMISVRMHANERAMVVAGCRILDIPLTPEMTAVSVRLPEPCDGWNTPFSVRVAGEKVWIRTFRGDIYSREPAETVWRRFAYGKKELPIPREFDEWVSASTSGLAVVVTSGKGFVTVNKGRKWDMIQAQPSEVMQGVSCFSAGCLVRSTLRLILLRGDVVK